MSPEIVQSILAGLLTGGLAGGAAVRATFKKLDKVDEHETRLIKLEERVEAHGEVIESVRTLTATINQVAQDVAYMKGLFEGIKAASGTMPRV